MDLTYWLRKSPQPVVVLADESRIEVPRNGRAWRDLTATIKAMEPSKLTCLDKAGNVIRSVVLESDAGDDKAAASPEMTDLQLFAKLLAEGYQHGMKANQPMVDNAMQYIDRQGQRISKQEVEIERLRGVVHKLNMQIAQLTSQPVAPAEDSVFGALAAGLLQAQQQEAAQPPPAGVSQIPRGPKK